MASSQEGVEDIPPSGSNIDTHTDTEGDELVANPGALWLRLSDFERHIARTRKDILNSGESVTAVDLRECVHNARADWPAAMEPFKDVEDAIERLLPYHACYEPGAGADDSAAHLDTVIANIGARVLAINKQTKLCREATKRDAAKRKLNVVKSIELEELSHKSGRLRQEIDRIEREVQLKRAAAKLQSTEIKTQETPSQPAVTDAVVKPEGIEDQTEKIKLPNN